MRGVALLGIRSHPAIFVAWTARGKVLLCFGIFVTSAFCKGVSH